MGCIGIVNAIISTISGSRCCNSNLIVKVATNAYMCRSPQVPKPSPVSITFFLSISQSTSPSLFVFLTLPHTSSQGSLSDLIQNLLKGFYLLNSSFSLFLVVTVDRNLWLSEQLFSDSVSCCHFVLDRKKCNTAVY